MSKPMRARKKHGGPRPRAGRRPKPLADRRDYGVKANFTRDEYAALAAHAASLGICISVLVARRALYPHLNPRYAPPSHARMR